MRYVKVAVIVALVMLFLLPIGFIFSSAFMSKEEAEYLMYSQNGLWPLIPRQPTFFSIIELLQKTPAFYRSFWNACAIVFPTILLQILVAAPAAWGLARYQFPFKKQIYFLYIFLMILPFSVTMLSVYFQMKYFGLLGSSLAIVVSGAFATFPVFIMERFFSSIPQEYIEEAASCGANQFQIFLYVGIPLGLPGIVASSLFAYLQYWNAVEQPMILLDKMQWPISLWLPGVSISHLTVSTAAAMFSALLALAIFSYGCKRLLYSDVALHRRNRLFYLPQGAILLIFFLLITTKICQIQIQYKTPVVEVCKPYSSSININDELNLYDLCVPTSAIHKDNTPHIYLLVSEFTIYGEETRVQRLTIDILAENENTTAINGDLSLESDIIYLYSIPLVDGELVIRN